MNHKVLLTTLSVAFGLAFAFHVCSSALHFHMNVLETKNRMEQRHSYGWFIANILSYVTVYDRDGFEVPVDMHFSYNEEIIQVAGKMKKEEEENMRWFYENNDRLKDNSNSTWNINLYKWNRGFYLNYDTIYKMDTLLTRAIVGKYDNGTFDAPHGKKEVESRFDDNIFNLLPLQRNMKSTVRIKPKTTGQFYFLLFRSQLNTLFYLFILYQLFQSVQILKSNFSFSSKFYNRIKIVGFAMLLYFLLQFLTDYSLTYFYHLISIHSSSTAINYIDDTLLSMNATHDFQFIGFSAGLLLIVFSILMKRSSEIENNWSLTI